MAASAQTDTINTVTDPKVHEMRISDHTQIKNAIRFALQWLQDYPGGELTLHTLPAPKSIRPGQAAPAATVQEDEDSRPTKRRKLASSTDDLPRLISVVEIIKREFHALVLRKKAGLGNPPGTLLHQYNVLACLEDREERLSNEEIFLALEVKNHFKRNLTPYMKITLCTRKVLHLEGAGATYQDPDPPKLKSKSAKARGRRAAAEAAENAADASVSE